MTTKASPSISGDSAAAPPPGFRTLKEGSASILYEYDESAGAKAEPVFYNKVQVLNRDLSIKMITLFARQRARERAGDPNGNRQARRQYKLSQQAAAKAAQKAGADGGEVAAASDATAAVAAAESSPPEGSSDTKPAADASAAEVASGAVPGGVLSLSTLELDAKLRLEAPQTGIRILDALAATGLRSIRYFNEIPGVKQVVTNDLDPAAVEAAKANVRFNGLTLAQVTPLQGDANKAMLFPAQLPSHPANSTAATTAASTAAEPVASALDPNGTAPPPKPPPPPPQYDVIDLDPYGTAAPFLDCAVQSVSDGGLLCVTCTDMASLSGNQPEACFAKYGSMPTRGKYLHEMALRILLHSLEESACRYRRHIVPVLCCGIDFYIRVFVRVFESPQEVKRTCLKRGYVFQSVRCPTFSLQPIAKLAGNGHSFLGALGPPHGHGVCPQTGGAFRIGGPMWTEPLHDMAWVKEALADVSAYKDQAASTVSGSVHAKGGGKKAHKQKGGGGGGGQKNGSGGDGGGGDGGGSGGGNGSKAADPVNNGGYQGPSLPFPPTQTWQRLHGLLTSVSEELLDVPLYYTLPSLCETLHCTSPKMDDFKSAIINAGYRVSAFHKEPDAVKTDAPAEVVWDIMRCWVKKHPISAARMEAENSPGAMILSTEPTLQADFSRPKGVSLLKPKAQRFPKNPEDHWGPKSRAKGKQHQEHPPVPAKSDDNGGGDKEPAAAKEEEGAAREEGGEPATKQPRLS